MSLDFCRFVTRMDRTIACANRVGLCRIWLVKASSAFDQGIDGLYCLGRLFNVFRAAGKVEQGINEAYDFLGGFSQKVRAAGKVEEGLNTAYSALARVPSRPVFLIIWIRIWTRYSP